jgi:hypothetical protein
MGSFGFVKVVELPSGASSHIPPQVAGMSTAKKFLLVFHFGNERINGSRGNATRGWRLGKQGRSKQRPYHG